MSQQQLASRSPYPGLRPFSGDEAIYFCGRESHIEVICDLLKQNKFLMVAGASGDGKSSLVFAGLVPAMQAGFFRAQHSEFRVASFRPERSPMENFASSLAGVLGESDVRSLQARLNYGFSSLVEIFQEAISEGPGYNLVIYADQFEELFTYPENYRDGKCSAEAQLLVNLLLETARISLEQNLPVYVVCTMRSDYIGQCSSFRGLAEYIGFSHYFVPRLNRLEMRRVIEEPAMLNGDDISPRLVERLLYDLEEGNDQLPVLQHALSRIWLLAGEKGEVMDLVHYAKAGGMPTGDLPKEQQNEFSSWLSGQPEVLQPIFSRPGLGNVLNLHAEGLLLEAVALCQKNNTGGEKSTQVPEGIFRCLTQVDRGRVVRHQVSAEELLQVLNIPELGISELDEITAVFRRPGNTFLRPFIHENSDKLKSDSVLDITHESLIRNWDKLAEWTEAEENDKQVFQDFDKQLGHWMVKEKSSDYLLPIGPLTQYETWFQTKNPNPGWLAGQYPGDESREKKLEKARVHLANAAEFIRKSARRLLLTRTVMKYGANRILLLAGSLVVALSCLYYYLEYRYKQNDAVVERIISEGKELMTNSNVSKIQKARFAILWERHHGENSFVPLLDSLHNDTLAFDIGLEMFDNTRRHISSNEAGGSSVGRDSIHPLLPRVTAYLEKIIWKFSAGKELSAGQAKRTGRFIMLSVCARDLSGLNKYQAQAEKAADILLEKYLLPIAGNPERNNENPFLFLQSGVKVAYLAKDSGMIRRLYRELAPGSPRAEKLFPAIQNFTFGTDGEIPRLGGPFLQQLLAERSGNFRQADSLRRAIEPSLQKNPEFKKEMQRHFYFVSFISGRNQILVEAQGGDEKFNQCIHLISNLGMAQESITLAGSRLLFQPGLMLDLPVKKKAIQVLSGSALNSLNGFRMAASAWQESFRLASLHSARSFCFQSFYQEKEAKQEADLSMKELAKIAFQHGAQPEIEQELQSLLDPIFSEMALDEYSTGGQTLSSSTMEYASKSTSWSEAFIRAGLGKPLWFKMAYRKKLKGFLSGQITGDSLSFLKNQNLIHDLLKVADEEPGLISFDSLVVFHSLVDLRKDLSLDAREIQKRAGKQPQLLNNLNALRQRLDSLKAEGILDFLPYRLVKRGLIKEALVVLDQLPADKRRHEVAKIVQKMNTSGVYAEFMPAILDKAFIGKEENPRYPASLFSAISSAGGLRFVDFGFNLLRNQEEDKKPEHLFQFMGGLCRIKMLHQAMEFIPKESSSDARMRFYNLIFSHEESPALRGKNWDSISFPFASGMVLRFDFGGILMEKEI